MASLLFFSLPPCADWVWGHAVRLGKPACPSEARRPARGDGHGISAELASIVAATAAGIFFTAAGSRRSTSRAQAVGLQPRRRISVAATGGGRGRPQRGGPPSTRGSPANATRPPAMKKETTKISVEQTQDAKNNLKEVCIGEQIFGEFQLFDAQETVREALEVLERHGGSIGFPGSTDRKLLSGKWDMIYSAGNEKHEALKNGLSQMIDPISGEVLEKTPIPGGFMRRRFDVVKRLDKVWSLKSTDGWVPEVFGFAVPTVSFGDRSEKDGRDTGIVWVWEMLYTDDNFRVVRSTWKDDVGTVKKNVFAYVKSE